MIYIKHSDKRSKSFKLKKTKIRNEAEKSSCLTASKCALNQKVLEKSASNTFFTDMGVFRPVLQWSLLAVLRTYYELTAPNYIPSFSFDQ